MNLGDRARVRKVTAWSLLAAVLIALSGPLVVAPSVLTASAAVVGDAYVPMAPTRALDTRSGATPAGGSTTQLQLAGRSGVPATARAVVLNVTAVSPTAPGYVTVFPAGRARPTASNLNFVTGQTIANQVIVDLGPTGAIAIYTSARSNIIVDVAGYFPSTRSFAGVTPTRLLDTRSSDAVPAAGSTTQVKVAGVAGVPARTAKAVVLNVTAVSPMASGYLSVYPGGNRPGASNVNYRPGQNIAGLVVAKVATDGTVTVYTAAKTHLIVDVLGWVPSESSIRPIYPTRLLDTRSGAVPTAGSTLKVPVVGRAWLPRSGVSVVELTVTAVTPTQGGYLTVYPGGAAPTASNLNFVKGGTIANSVTAKVGADGTVSVRVSAATHVLVDIAGFGVSTGSPAWSEPSQLGSRAEVTGLSCPTASFCAAVDDSGGVSVRNGSRWADRLLDPLAQWTAVSCASPASCVVVGTKPATGGARAAVFATFDGTTWSTSRPLPGTAAMGGLSCPSTDFCLAVGSQAGRSVVLSYDGQTWVQRPGPNVAGLTVVSCVSAQYCVAGSTTGGAVRWTGVDAGWRYAPEYLDDAVSSVSCASVDVCLITGTGYGVVSINGDRIVAHYNMPYAWNPRASCSSPQRCTIVADDRRLVFSPATGTFAASDTRAGGFNAISCPTDTFCARASKGGAVTTETNGTVSLTHVVNVGQGSITQVDCPVVGTCLMADATGHRFRVDGTTVGPVFSGTDGPVALSCSSVDHCATVGQATGIITRTMMIGGVWSEASDYALDRDVSCATSTFCMTVGQRGSYAWDGTSWRKVGGSLTPTAHLVDCVDPNWCLAVTNGANDLDGNNGARINLWNGRSWTQQVAAMPNISAKAIECTARDACLLVTGDGRSSRLTGAGWSQPSAAPVDLTRLSCASAEWCVAIDASGQSYQWDGADWSVIDAIPANAISCPAVGRCVAVGERGEMRVLG